MIYCILTVTFRVTVLELLLGETVNYDKVI